MNLNFASKITGLTILVLALNACATSSSIHPVANREIAQADPRHGGGTVGDNTEQQVPQDNIPVQGGKDPYFRGKIDLKSGRYRGVKYPKCIFNVTADSNDSSFAISSVTPSNCYVGYYGTDPVTYTFSHNVTYTDQPSFTVYKNSKFTDIDVRATSEVSFSIPMSAVSSTFLKLDQNDSPIKTIVPDSAKFDGSYGAHYGTCSLSLNYDSSNNILYARALTSKTCTWGDKTWHAFKQAGPNPNHYECNDFGTAMNVESPQVVTYFVTADGPHIFAKAPSEE